VYTVTVRGYNVPQGPQPYALVVTGAGALSGSSVSDPERHDYYLPIVFKDYPPSAPLPPPSPVLLANGDFEAGRDGSWTEYSHNGWPLIVNDFAGNQVTPHSGSWAAWLGGDYDEVAELSQEVSIPAGNTSVALTYWYWMGSEDECGYDHGWFEVDGTQLKTYDLCYSGSTGDWVKETVNVGSYAGQTVTVKFHVDTDGSLNSNFFLDDVAFQTSPSAADDLPRSPVITDLSDAQPRR
jgi:hypothetical protein